MPNLVYMVRVSGGGDHDFYNLSLQSGIWKMTLGVSLMLLLNTTVGGAKVFTDSHKVYLGIKLGVMIAFGIFCAVRKLNMKKESVKHPAIMFLAGYVGSIVVICF